MSIFSTEGRGAIYDNIIDTIGNTPVVKINNIAPKHVSVFVKIEAFNPGGSVKDRLARNIIEAAERSGALKPGQTIVEATSGNTGIGLAMVCAAKGYPLVVTMVETFSVERRKLMRFLGAKVVLTPKELKGYGMVVKAQELAEKNGWFLASQFETTANADIHAATTAQEILVDFKGRPLDYLVSGYGTGGTVTGIARVLKQQRPLTKVMLVEPSNAGLVASGYVNNRNDDHQPTESHPSFEPHPIQGWTPDFIPYVLQESIDNQYFDEVVPVEGTDAMKWSQRLAKEEGIFCGISCGATFAAAMQIAETAPAGAVMLVMLPDTGERYLSTPLFDDVTDYMTEEELAMSNMTPTGQMS